MNVSQRYSIDFTALAQIVREYIMTNHYDLYSMKMGKLCEHYEPFVKQEISDVVDEAIEHYQFLGSVTELMIDGNRITFSYQEEE